MMAQAKRITRNILMVETTLFSFCVTVFSKRNRKHVLRVSISYRNTRESLEELEKAVVFQTFTR